jgi:predicted DNA-binding transcriptional regulator AlpA
MIADTEPLAPRKKRRPKILPALIGRDDAAAMSGTSVAMWDRLSAAALNPKPIKLGGRVLWNRRELQRWADAGAPDRRTWEALKAAKKATKG